VDGTAILLSRAVSLKREDGNRLHFAEQVVPAYGGLNQGVGDVIQSAGVQRLA
jgi:hypothetical protein